MATMSMGDTIINLMRSGTRPVVTVGLAGAFVAAALSPIFGADVEDAKFAASTLGGPFGIVVGHWFASRAQKPG